MGISNFDPDKQYDINLQIMFNISFLFDKANASRIDGLYENWYHILGCIYNRLVNIMPPDRIEKINKMITDIDRCTDYQSGMFLERDKARVQQILCQWEVELQKQCIENKFWFKTFKDVSRKYSEDNK
jgi:hypothetical protein